MITIREHGRDGLNIGEAAVDMLEMYAVMANRMGILGWKMYKMYMAEDGNVVLIFQVEDADEEKFSTDIQTVNEHLAG